MFQRRESILRLDLAVFIEHPAQRLQNLLLLFRLRLQVSFFAWIVTLPVQNAFGYIFHPIRRPVRNVRRGPHRDARPDRREDVRFRMSAFFARFRRVRTAALEVKLCVVFRHLPPPRVSTNASASSSSAAGGREKRSSDATRVLPRAEKDEHVCVVCRSTKTGEEMTTLTTINRGGIYLYYNSIGFIYIIVSRRDRNDDEVVYLETPLLLLLLLLLFVLLSIDGLFINPFFFVSLFLYRIVHGCFGPTTMPS